MKEYNLPEPVFENKRNEFVVTLYNNQHTSNNNEDIDLISFCKTPKSRKEIAEYLDIKTTSFVTKEYIQPLVDAGKVNYPRLKHLGFLRH